MELRGENKEIGVPSSLGYLPPAGDSSSKGPSATKVSSCVETIRGQRTSTPQNLENHPVYHHHQLNRKYQSLKPTRDCDLTPDPAPALAAAPAPIPTNTATQTAPTRSGSIARSSPAPAPISTTTPAASTAEMSSVTYRECLKNHAASKGGHVVDGCGEFMPSGQEGSQDALKCAACECHRNFHRKEIDGEPQYVANSTHHKINGHRNTFPPPHQQLAVSLPMPQPPLHQHHGYHHGSLNAYTAPVSSMMMNFGGVGGGGGPAAESSSEDLNMFESNRHGQASVQPSLLKKRFRTKFSQEQKEKMMEFAERIGWKIQKQDDQELQQFCSQVGVKRKVFKVWMHNNKQAMKKKQM